ELCASQLFLKLGQKTQRFERRHAIDVRGREPLAKFVVLRGRLKQSQLLLRVGARPADRRPAAAGELVALERVQDLARSCDDARRQACKARDLDAVTPIGSA